jgi:hypothetical protein
VSRPVYVRAWYLTEGDVLPGGERIISMQRDPGLDRVAVVTSDGARRVLYRDDWLVVGQRAASAGSTAETGGNQTCPGGWLRSGGRVGAVGWLVRATGHRRGRREDGVP